MIILLFADPSRRLPKHSNAHKQFGFTGMLYMCYTKLWQLLATGFYCLEHCTEITMSAGLIPARGVNIVAFFAIVLERLAFCRLCTTK